MNEPKSKLRSPWRWVVFVLIAFGVWGLVFYQVSLPTTDEQLDVWVGFPTGLNADIRNAVSQIAEPYGIKQVNFGTYSPTDSMYQQAFAVKAQYTDIFILTKDEAQAIADTDKLFAVVDGATEGLTNADGKIVAVPMVGEMYVAYSSVSKKDPALLRQIVDYLVSEK